MNRQFGDHKEYKIYDRNSLELVSVALKFATILKLTESPVISRFQEAIRSEFTEYSFETGMLVQINPDGLSQIEQKQHRFYNKSDTSSITLTSDQLAFQTSDHYNRESSMGSFNLALRGLRDVCDDLISPERYGVRYVNSIDKEKIASDLNCSLNWSDLVSEKFLSIPGRQAGEDDTRYYCEVNSAMSVGRLISRYGLLPAQPARSSELPRVVFRFDCDRFIDHDISLDKLDVLSLELCDDIYVAFQNVRGSKLVDWMSAEITEENLP